MKRLAMVLGMLTLMTGVASAGDRGHDHYRGSRGHGYGYSRRDFHDGGHRHHHHHHHRDVYRYAPRPHRHSTFYAPGFYGPGVYGAPGFYGAPGYYYGGSGFSYSTPGFSLWIGGR